MNITSRDEAWSWPAQKPRVLECAHLHQWLMVSENEPRRCPVCGTITFAALRALAAPPSPEREQQPRTSNEEEYAWECAENMRQWAIRAEATTKLWAARASAAEAILRRMARECRHYDDFPEPCAACLADIGLTTESAHTRTTPESDQGHPENAPHG